MYRSLAFASSLAAVARGQLVGTMKTETHPEMTWSECSAYGSCTNNTGAIVVDANWRWLHDAASGSSTNCYTGNAWNTDLCTNNTACATNCALEGADYSGTYGATTSGDSLTLKFVTQSTDKNIGSRMYLMDTETTYQQFSLLNKEFTFDVDVSNLPCGLNGALYFVSMDADGGMAKYPTNKAGAKYGVGYCDSQCPRDLKFINGEVSFLFFCNCFHANIQQANVEGWVPSTNDANAGVGNHGSCCAEMDIFEANSISTAYTPHPCDSSSQIMCIGDDCGGTYSDTRYAGTCDPDGCDYNSYRMGDTSFYGSGMTVDTTAPFTVVTQFIGEPLTEIKRFYVQNGKVIPNSETQIPGTTGNSITTEFCDAQKTAFGDNNVFDSHGGLSKIGDALSAGMTLVMSIWDDHYSDMLWLDSTYPTNSTGLGAARGTCATDSGVPFIIESANADASVTFSNIRFGPMNSTFDSSAVESGTTPGSSSSAAAGQVSTSSAVSSAAAISASVVAAKISETSAALGGATSAVSAEASSVETSVIKTSTAAGQAVQTSTATSVLASESTTSTAPGQAISTGTSGDDSEYDCE
jgi:cellulose 1,4-beta-cellobiosidase